MSQALETIHVELLNKLFEFKCPEQEVDDLKSAAAYLNDKMVKFRQQGQTIGFEQSLMMAAVEITVESLQQNKSPILNTEVLEAKVQHLRQQLKTIIDRYN